MTKFLRLRRKYGGLPVLINAASIAHVEINGTPDMGSVLWLTYPGEPGKEPPHEVVQETLDDVSRMLGAITSEQLTEKRCPACGGRVDKLDVTGATGVIYSCEDCNAHGPWQDAVPTTRSETPQRGA